MHSIIVIHRFHYMHIVTNGQHHDKTSKLKFMVVTIFFPANEITGSTLPYYPDTWATILRSGFHPKTLEHQIIMKRCFTTSSREPLVLLTQPTLPILNCQFNTISLLSCLQNLKAFTALIHACKTQTNKIIVTPF